jgi:hypothetical protein
MNAQKTIITRTWFSFERNECLNNVGFIIVMLGDSHLPTSYWALRAKLINQVFTT